MDRWKKKVKSKSKKNISDPQDFTHLRHIGPQNLDQLGTEGNNNETTSDQRSEDKDLGEIVKGMILSTEFQEVLRTIVREETGKALADERHTLLKELQTVDSLTYSQVPCAVYGDDKVSEKQSTVDCPSSDIKNSTGNLNGSQILRTTPNENEERTAEENSSPATQQKQLKDNSASSCLDQKSLSSIKKETAIQKAPLKPCIEIRRECLSRAVQAHIIPIVDSLDFNRSSLPEQLISAGHITEEECAAIRDEKRTRKDQIRYVITRSKSRSLQDIETFLELIEKQIPHVVIEIRKTFEKTLNSNKIHDSTFNKCALCLCYDNIDVKEAADILWSTESISDGFYKDIVDCSKPRGCQGHIWKKLIELCNDKLTVDKQDIYDPLFDLISKRGNFDFIVKPLKNRLTKIGQLVCDCNSITFLKPNSLERASRASSGISATPRSSASDERHSSLSGEFTKQVNVDDGMVIKDSKLRFRKLARQSSLTDDKTDETFPKQRLYQSASLEILRTITEESDRQFQTGRLLTSRRLQFHKSESDLKRKLQDGDVYFSRQIKNMQSEGSAAKRHGWTNKDVDDLKRDLSQ